MTCKFASELPGLHMNINTLLINTLRRIYFATLAQRSEHRAYDAKVVGSIPTCSINIFL